MTSSASKTSIIGKPIYNNKVYILDGYLNSVPIGVRGEIFVSGSSLSRGYLKDTNLTREKFISSPFIKDELIYRTGDIGKWLPDGNIEYIGRKDNQIKIKGFRIEIGEIESKLYQYEKIKEVAVITYTDLDGNTSLYAYLVSNVKLNSKGIREFLLSQIPEYMIPSYFIQLDALPKMNNGKIDKQALLLPEKSDILRSKYIPPRNNVEKTLQRVWCNVLGLKEISINDDFFILGGDSLKAMKIVSDISRKYKINFEDVYKYSTIAELASNIIGKKSYNNS